MPSSTNANINIDHMGQYSNLVQIPRNTRRTLTPEAMFCEMQSIILVMSWCNLNNITMKDILRRATVIFNTLGKKSRGRWRVRPCLRRWGAGDVAHPLQGIQGPFPSSEHIIHMSQPAPIHFRGIVIHWESASLSTAKQSIRPQSVRFVVRCKQISR